MPPQDLGRKSLLLLGSTWSGSALGMLVSILVVRLLNNYLPDSVFGTEHVWAAHLLIGLVFSGFALVLWAKRKPQTDEG